MKQLLISLFSLFSLGASAQCTIDSVNAACTKCMGVSGGTVHVYNVDYHYGGASGSHINYTALHTYAYYGVNSYVKNGHNHVSIGVLSFTGNSYSNDTLQLTVQDSLTHGTCSASAIVSLACDTIFNPETAPDCSGSLYSVSLNSVTCTGDTGGLPSFNVDVVFDNYSSDTVLGAPISCTSCNYFTDPSSGAHFYPPGITHETLGLVRNLTDTGQVCFKYIAGGNCSICTVQGCGDMPAVTKPTFTYADTVICESYAGCYHAVLTGASSLIYSTTGGYFMDTFNCVINTTANFQVTALAVDSNGCAAWATKSVIVNPLPLDKRPFLTDSTLCFADSAQVNVPTSQTGIKYYLFDGYGHALDSVSGTGSNVAFKKFAIDSFNEFIVNAVNQTTGCYRGLAPKIYVIMPGVPAIPTAQTYCSNSSHSFTFSSVAAGSAGNKVEWALNPNFTSSTTIDNGGTISVTVGSGTVDTIWLRTKNDTSGCMSKAVFTTAAVYGLPTASVLPQDTSIYLGYSVSLTANGGGTYLWSTSGLTTQIITVSPSEDSMHYTVTVTNTHGCTQVTTAVVRTIKNNPVEKGVVWVTVNDYNLMPALETSDTIPSTGDMHLNTIFRNLDVNSYVPLAPGSKQPGLIRAFEIRCTCDEKRLRDSLAQNFSGRVSNVSRVPLGESFYTPNDYTNMYGFTAGKPLWYLDTIKAKLAWDISKGDSNIKIGIIDNYFDVHEPDIGNKVLVRYNMFRGDTVLDEVACVHGTAISGFAAAETDDSKGYPAIGFKSRLLFYGIGVYSIDHPCQIVSVGAGLKAVHRAITDGADVINMSWGGYTISVPGDSNVVYINPDSFINYTTAFLKEAYDAGVTLIAAEGNCGQFGGCTYVDQTGVVHQTVNLPSFPASDSNVIAVAGVDSVDQKADFSSYHTYVALTAPAYNMAMDAADYVDTSDPGSLYYSGNSVATPLVSGTVALMLAKNPCLTEADIRYILQHSAKNIDALNPAYIDSIGAGRLDAYKALQLLVDSFLERPYTISIGYTIASDSTVRWSGNYLIHGPVVIKDRGRLLIDTAVLEFDYKDSSGIFIEPGGYLELDSAKLTSRIDCKRKMWKGIEMGGNPNADMTGLTTDYTAGISKCIIKHGTIIENAYSAILGGNQQAIYWHGGGPNGGCWVDATNSIFRNNYNGVLLGTYNRYNRSNFIKCSFEQTEPLKDMVEFRSRQMETFVGLTNVKNIYFQGCTFKNYVTGDNGIRFGKGISAWASGFTIKPYGADSCKFIGLEKGIEAFQIGGFDRNMSVRQAVFDSTYKCITSNGSRYDRIFESTFNILFDSTITDVRVFGGGGNTQYNVYRNTWGIFMYNSDNYNISGNGFNAMSGYYWNSNMGYVTFSHGIIARNTGGGGGLIKKNAFTNTDIGGQTEESNPSLRFICNTFTDNGFALNINPGYGDYTLDDATIYDTLAPQGYACAYGKTAANTFVTSGWVDANNPSDFWFKYYAPDTPSTRIPTYNDNSYKDTVIACAGIADDDQTCNTLIVSSTNYYPPFTGAGCYGCMVLNGDLLDGHRLADSVSLISDPAEKLLVANDVVQAFLELDDSTGNAEIKNFLDNWDDKSGKLIMAASYQYLNDKTTVESYLSGLTGLSDDNTQYKDILTIAKNIYFPSDSVTPGQLESLQGYSDNGYISDVYAQSLLATYAANQYERIPQGQAGFTRHMLRRPENPDISAEQKPILKVYPNPAHDAIIVQYESDLQTVIKITDLYGRKVYEANVASGQIFATVNLSSFLSGTYVVDVQSETGNVGKSKFIVLK